jgi:L-cystine transport system permease protein
MQPIHFIKIITFIPQLAPFLGVTFEYVLLSLFFGSIIGFILAIAKLRENKIFKALANGYTTVLRCTPSIVLLFLVFFGLPVLIKSLLGINIENANALIFVVITFTMFLSASLSEVMRASYGAVDKGQFEAAVSVGLSNIQAFKRIMLPQAFYVAIPNLGNTTLYLIKEGALGFTIGLVDIMGKANLINSETMGGYVLEIYLALALIYWPISILIEKSFKRLEKRYEFEHKEQVLRKSWPTWGNSA